MSETNVSTVQNCLHCGSQLTIVSGRGKWRKCCDKICSGRHHAKKAKVNLPSCVADGCLMLARSRKAKYCERHYGRIRRVGTFVTINNVSVHDKCLHCGKPTGNGSNKFCSIRCRARHQRGCSSSADCRVCGKAFIPHQKNICCSKECREELERIYSRNHYAKWIVISDDYRKRIRNAEYKRKALRRDAFVEVVDIRVVFIRDNGVCWLCGESVDQHVKWPDVGYATLDHVIPLSKGGEHSYSNVKLAHLSCNCKKGARLVG